MTISVHDQHQVLLGKQSSIRLTVFSVTSRIITHIRSCMWSWHSYKTWKNRFRAELATQLASPKYEIRFVTDTENMSRYGCNPRRAKLHKIWHMTMRRDIRRVITEIWRCLTVVCRLCITKCRDIYFIYTMYKCCVAMSHGIVVPRLTHDTKSDARKVGPQLDATFEMRHDIRHIAQKSQNDKSGVVPWTQHAKRQ